MRILSSIIAATVVVTTPISVAKAQSSYGDCMAQCDQYYYQQLNHCAQYGASLQGEYCYYGAGLEWDACRQGCPPDEIALIDDGGRVQRFHPVTIRVGSPRSASHT